MVSKINENDISIDDQYYVEKIGQIKRKNEVNAISQAKLLTQYMLGLEKKKDDLCTNEILKILNNKLSNKELEKVENSQVKADDSLLEIQTIAEKLYFQTIEEIEAYNHEMNEIEADIVETEKLLHQKKQLLQKTKQSLEKKEETATDIDEMLATIQKRETKTERARRLNDGTMVTVICVTYNHEKYLAQTLDSFIMQKTSFKFKVFVGEDCSTDGTREILRKYAEKYPEIIVPFYRENNLGAMENTYDLLMHLTSPFVAYCEGDDYWTDEYKLQKQYDLMQQKSYLRACFHNTEMLNNRDFANDWFCPDKNNRILIPGSYPSFNQNIKEFDANYYIKTAPAHTSSMFFRWNYEVKIPNEFVNYPSGDHFMMLIQLGKGKIGFISDVMSVYRRNETGLTWADGDNTKRWLQTRDDWVFMTFKERNYFIENYDNYATTSIENRLKLEAYNFLEKAIKEKKYDEIAKFFSRNQEAVCIALSAYLIFYQDSRLLTGCYSWEGYKLLVRNKWVRNSIKPYIKFLLWFNKNIDIKKIGKKIIALQSIVKYWLNALIPKRKNLWVFSALQKKDYIDNTKYLFEYIIEKHPEIDAVWLTQDDAVIKKLNAEGKKVFKMSSRQGKKIMKQASIAVTDHYRVTDFNNNWGFNARTKVVQLWHGVGLKDMKRIIEISSYKKIGLFFSDDIIAQIGDSFITKCYKKIKYIRYAHSRELFEKYFLLLCPGQEHIDKIADVYHLSHDRCFLSGHPRNINLYTMEPNINEPKILYAPTLRNYAEGDFLMVKSCALAFGKIQKCMEKINAQFIIRLHPYTFHNCEGIITESLNKYDRIHLDTSRDIYESLGQYNLIISDYSSIAFDFIMIDRPVIFHCPDLDEYLLKDNGISYNYNDITPGPKTKSWEETLVAVEEYIANPEKDSEWRKEVGAYFFDPAVNDINNSERIVCEIKRRLGMK